MKQIIVLFFATLIFSNSLKSQHKLSKRQEKLSIYIKKYQNAIKNAPDSVSKFEVYSDMWRKHIIFIQDTLKFSTYPTYTLDTFYFEKAHVNYTSENKRKYIQVSLENKEYAATTSFDVTNNINLQIDPLYKMLGNLKDNAPVLAAIHLQDLSLSDNNIDKGSKKIMLIITLKGIYNVK